MARFFLGPIARVQAVGQNVVDPAIAAAGDIDAAAVLLTAADGGIAVILNDRRCAYGYDQRLEAFGSQGMLEGRNQQGTSVEASTATYTGARNRVQDFFLQRYADAYRLELDAFITAVESGTIVSPDLNDGYEALVLADAALRAAQTGTAVDVGCAATTKLNRVR